MKLKIYNFSGPSELETDPSLAPYLENFEVIPFQNLTPEQTLAKKFDFIELNPNDYEKFKPFINAVGWKVNHLGVADVLMRDGAFYRPLSIVADGILRLIRERMSSISTSTSVLVIGEFSFVLSVTAKLALAGFSHFIISLNQDNDFLTLEKRLKEFIFNLSLTYVKLNELTQIQSTSSLLISNLTEKMNSEAYESLAYFNFLAHGAVFVDFNSSKNASLTEEARRAELAVIQEIEILTLKYKTLLELSKNSSKV